MTSQKGRHAGHASISNPASSNICWAEVCTFSNSNRRYGEPEADALLLRACCRLTWLDDMRCIVKIRLVEKKITDEFGSNLNIYLVWKIFIIFKKIHRCHFFSLKTQQIQSIQYPNKSEQDMRPFNFSAGPAMLPESVLSHAQAEVKSWRGCGISVMVLVSILSGISPRLL